MKTLNIEQMEQINGGANPCSAAGYIGLGFGLVGFGLALVTTGGAAGALIISQALVADGVAVSTGLGAALAGCLK